MQTLSLCFSRVLAFQDVRVRRYKATGVTTPLTITAPYL